MPKLYIERPEIPFYLAQEKAKVIILHAICMLYLNVPVLSGTEKQSHFSSNELFCHLKPWATFSVDGPGSEWSNGAHLRTCWQGGQNHSPSGMIIRGGRRQAVW